jgi:hypothetical protein
MANKLLTGYMPGKGPVALRPTDHLATGGEGAVYLKNGIVFKVFLDPQKAQANGMAEKIALLSKLQHPFIVAPQDVLLDDKHNVIGYYMPEASGIPLMKTFTNSWRDLNAFTDAQSIQLVENMREAVSVAHNFGAVMVDGNETNYLTHGVDPRVIDVDSWQIGKHKATAIMPSVRDYHAKTFNANTDWFSWGVVSFQVFTGIHPYKGTHPDFKKGDTESRMRANASVFDSRVRLNAAVRDFSCVPGPLLDWYERVFSQGERSAPPSALQSRSAPKLTKKTRVVTGGTGSVRHDRIRGFAGKIRHVAANGVAYYWEGPGLKAFDLQRQQGIPALSTADIEKLFSNDAVLMRHADSFVYVAISETGIQGRKVAGERDPQPMVATAMTNVLPLATHRLVVMGTRFFALNTQSDNGLIELDLAEMGSKVALAVKMSWPVNVQSTQFFDGCAVMDCLGVPFVAVPEQGSLLIQRAPALAGYKLINGLSRGSARVWVHGVSRVDGQIYRIELRSTGREFEVLQVLVVDEALLNIAINAKGIAVGFLEDGSVRVTSTTSTSEKQILDPSVTVAMHLFSLPDGIYYSRDQDIFKVSLS